MNIGRAMEMYCVVPRGAMNDEGFAVFFYDGKSLGLLLVKNLTNGNMEFNVLFKKFGGRSNGS